MKLAIFATHPVQYHAALWRSLAAVVGLDIHVYFFSDASLAGGLDPGFGIPVAWDVPLLEGYPHTFLSRDAVLSRSWGIGMRGAKALLAKGGYDWVLLQGYTHRFERQVLRAAKGLGTRVLMRGEFSDGALKSKMRAVARDSYLKWFYGKVDAFCSVGVTAAEHLKKRGVDQKGFHFSPYHVDSELFEREAARLNRDKCRASLGIPGLSFVFLFSGKFIPRKEPLLLLEAMRRLRHNRDLHLIMLGDGPLREQILLQGTAVLGERFHAPGFVNQSALGRYFAAADVMVLPSRYETWGLVVNEAMYFGLPSIVSDRVGCQPDLVQPGKTGWVFRSADKEGLSTQLQAAMEDRKWTEAMGQNAKVLVRRYSTEAARDGILQAVGLFID